MRGDGGLRLHHQLVPHRIGREVGIVRDGVDRPAFQHAGLFRTDRLLEALQEIREFYRDFQDRYLQVFRNDILLARAGLRDRIFLLVLF